MSAVEGVGQNLKDHHVVLNLPFAARHGAAFSLAQYASLDTFKKYVYNKTGECGVSVPTQAVG